MAIATTMPARRRSRKITSQSSVVTPEELLSMSDGDRFELVNGQLVEHKMSMKSSWVAGQILFQLQTHLKSNPAGMAFPEGASYQCFPNDPGRVRKADVSFIRSDRFNEEQFEQGHCRIAPDLTVEVVSPNDLHWEVAEKLEDYFSAGVPLVWLVEPETETVTVYRNGAASISQLHVTDELDGEGVLPGFRCRVAEIFPPSLPADVRTH